MKNAEAAIERLCDPETEVSTHYLISRHGQSTCLVAEDLRAWHAGAGQWQAKDDMNSRSIGIELDNDGTSPFAASLMNALEPLLKDVLSRWNIPPQNVIGHADMAPGRKSDPGPRFDWARLQRIGLAATPDFAPTPTLFQEGFELAELTELLRAIGYTTDDAWRDKLQAFRDRFLPVSKGAPNGADRGMMLSYLNSYGSSSLC